MLEKLTRSTAWRNPLSKSGQRAKAEAAMSRYKRVIGDTLRSQAGPAQEVETQIAVKALNRMLGLGRPGSVRAARKRKKAGGLLSLSPPCTKVAHDGWILEGEVLPECWATGA